jgi:hypothetical protein
MRATGKKKLLHNKMATQAVAATGVRVVGMYVQEFFHWGWQPYGQENDDGIDGEIIPRYPNGNDMGVRIYVQVKSGPSYLSSINEETVNVSPYPNKHSLTSHVEQWNKSHEPVILVYVNAEKKNAAGYKYFDLKNPAAWWMRMDNYQHDGSSIIKIPRKNLFQEHIKGDLVKLIKPYVKDWIHYPEIQLEKEDLLLWNSESIKEDAKQFYKEWSNSNPTFKWNEHELSVKVSRTGWRHITYKGRKERVTLSKRLLPIAKKMLKQSGETKPILLRAYYPYTFWDAINQHLGLRARVKLDGMERKIQVVLKRYVNKRNNIEKFWFYSVHIIK